MNPRPLTTLSIAATLAFAGGCVPLTPALDSTFGESVRIAQARQTLNPDASKNMAVVRRFDGPAAKHAYDRYLESFKQPPPTNIFTINVGGGAGAAGGAGGGGR